MCQAQFNGALKWQLTGKHQIVTKKKSRKEKTGGRNQEGENGKMSMSMKEAK